MQQHQRQQTERFGLVGHQLHQCPGQADRLRAQAGPDQLGPGGGGVALVEQQVQHGEHGAGPFQQHVVGRDPEGYARVADLALGPHQALRHGGFGDQERPGDLSRGEAGQSAQGEGDLGVQGQGGMTAGEHQAQAVIPARPASRIPAVVLLGPHGHLLQPGRAGGRPAHAIDSPVAGHGRQPGARAAGHALAGPAVSALAKASWAHSSAASQSPVRRMRVATMRPHSSRKAVDTAACTAGVAPPAPSTSPRSASLRSSRGQRWESWPRSRWPRRDPCSRR